MKLTQEQTCADIMKLLDMLKSALFELAEEQGITKIQLFALYAIDEYDELVMSKAAGVLHCDPSNITGLVDRLVAQQLIVREECPHDRRSKMLRPTAKGREMIAQVKQALPVKLGCHKLTADEQATFHLLIQKIYS